MSAIHVIEQAAFADPWSADDFRECLVNGLACLVAVGEDGVAGYVVARRAADEGEILNLGVAARARRQGVGRALVRAAIAALGTAGARAVYLEVRESNAAARRLYEGLGFSEVARRRAYYRRPTEDAVILKAAISADGGAA
ncbi:MAG: ribosomal protein S18-alanine N-acetyltransferase [Gemmatimonadales bacterium]